MEPIMGGIETVGFRGGFRGGFKGQPLANESAGFNVSDSEKFAESTSRGVVGF
jgi:hypothetical protein